MRLPATTCLALLALSLTACGDEGGRSASDDERPTSVTDARSCLTGQGAKIASSASDLAFANRAVNGGLGSIETKLTAEVGKATVYEVAFKSDPGVVFLISKPNVETSPSITDSIRRPTSAAGLDAVAYYTAPTAQRVRAAEKRCLGSD